MSNRGKKNEMMTFISIKKLVSLLTQNVLQKDFWLLSGGEPNFTFGWFLSLGQILYCQAEDVQSIYVLQFVASCSNIHIFGVVVHHRLVGLADIEL